MAKIIDYLNNSDKTLFSCEILPPMKGESINTLFENIAPLIEFSPKFIDVTYHREEYVYKDMGDGLLERQAVRKRPGTVGICAAIMNKFQIETVPHIICGGFNQEETENVLIDFQFLGIHNVMALRGDPIKSENTFKSEKNGHAFATDLVRQIDNLNKGKYLSDEIAHPNPTNFCIGVAGYPEKHYESPNLGSDLKYLKQKTDLGADYIVTQMFFDNKKYFDFVKRCRADGITAPIIPGLKPITSKAQIVNLTRTFHIDIPEDLANAIESCKSNADVKKMGIEWAIHQAKELMQNKAPCLHFFCMGKAQEIQTIASALY